MEKMIQEQEEEEVAASEGGKHEILVQGISSVVRGTGMEFRGRHRYPSRTHIIEEES